MPTTSCVINNYNYRSYVVEAIQSALNQTVPFSEIIVIDDCSTDDSAAVLKEAYGNNPRVTLHFCEKNGGQLAAFNKAREHVSGDLVFFLDADDRYLPEYLSQALNFYEQTPSCEFLFCGLSFFGNKTGVELLHPENRDFGYSRILSLFGAKGETYVGSATSTLSMRRSIFAAILPFPFTEEWRSRADDCLVWGASIVGARKFYLAEDLVEYRIHSSNAWAGKRFSSLDRYRREIAIKRLKTFYMNKEGIDPSVVDFAYREFKTIPHPTKREFTAYLKITAFSTSSFFCKMRGFGEIVHHYVKPASEADR